MCFSLFPAFFLPSCLSLSNDWGCHVQFPSALFVLPVCFPTYSNASGLHRATGPCRSKGTGDLLEAPQPCRSITVPGPARRPAGVLARLAWPGLAWGTAGRGPPPPSARLLLRGRAPVLPAASPPRLHCLPRVPFAGLAPTIRLLMARYLWTAPPTPGGGVSAPAG